MGRYLIRRSLQLLYVLIGISTALFFLLRLSGDPIVLLVADDATPEQIEGVRRAYGLADPLPLQYARFLWGMARLEFGDSLKFHQPALQMVLTRLPATVELALGATAFVLLVAPGIGILAAVRRHRIEGQLAMVGALIGQSMPSFWLGVLLILVFAVNLGVLPSFGRGDFTHLLLPAITLGAVHTAKIMRLMRSGMLEVLSQDYIRTAKAKGLPGELVIWKHALKNTLIAVVTVLGLEVGQMLGGAVITETIFAWPGIGRQLVQAVLSRDYPLVQATVFLVALMVASLSLIVDLLYRVLDPRIQVR